jgi:hypothetical protein
MAADHIPCLCWSSQSDTVICLLLVMASSHENPEGSITGEYSLRQGLWLSGSGLVSPIMYYILFLKISLLSSSNILPSSGTLTISPLAEPWQHQCNVFCQKIRMVFSGHFCGMWNLAPKSKKMLIRENVTIWASSPQPWSINDDIGHVLSSGWEELITSIISSGTFVGTITTGLIADRFGRKEQCT